jgi:SAM-dependent methyltransferase
LNPNSTADHYDGSAGRLYHEKKRGIPDVAVPWVAQHRAKKIAPYIKPTGVVFEYGVGWGWNLAALECSRKIGYDVSDILRDKVTGQGIEFISSAAQLAPDSADVIICHHTLEHLLDPPRALQEMKLLLKPAGKLLLFVPFERESKYTRFDPAEPNHHLYSWNAQTLGNLVQQCGYNVHEAHVAPFGYDRFSAVWADRLKLGAFGFRFIRSLAHIAKPAFEVRVVCTR